MLAAKQAKAQGGPLVVAALQPLVREIFEISRFTLVLPGPSYRAGRPGHALAGRPGRLRRGLSAAAMLIRFWGTRGSIPVALTVADVSASSSRAGAGGRARASTPRRRRAPSWRPSWTSRSPAPSGATPPACRSRPAAATTSSATWAAAPGPSATRARHARAARPPFHVFMSHLHWDHIMGFPFFMPAYLPGNRVRDLRRPRRPRGGVPPPARGAVIPGGFLATRRAASSSCASSPAAPTTSRACT